MTSLRKAPRSPFDDAPPGHCRMCGEIIPAKDGSPNKGRRWCDAHKIDGQIRKHDVFVRAAVFLRDRGICRDCGTDCTSYEAVNKVPTFWGEAIVWRANRPYRVQINRERALEWCERILTKSPGRGVYVIDLGEWEADHVYPLWLVDREAEDAWKHWTLDNLVTRCPSCHQEKTSKEAGQRAKVKRLSGEVVKKRRGPKIAQRKDPWPKGRKLQSRPFRSAGK